MTIFEILELQKDILTRLANNGVNIEDCRYIDLYNEYRELFTPETKKTYLVVLLAEKYKVSERQVYLIISKFERSVI